MGKRRTKKSFDVYYSSVELTAAITSVCTALTEFSSSTIDYGEE
jgi:hypothetical protein